MEKEIKENIDDINPTPTLVDRNQMTLQKFMEDMIMLGQQVKNPDVQKPNFNYGDLSVTNYLLWLVLGELMMLNDGVAS